MGAENTPKPTKPPVSKTPMVDIAKELGGVEVPIPLTPARLPPIKPTPMVPKLDHSQDKPQEKKNEKKKQ